jgi:serine/threonine-protein kinase RsbT
MPVLKSEVVPVDSEPHVVAVRQSVRAWSQELGFSLVDQTKIVTAASELARNTIKHGGGGTLRMELLHEGIRKGLRLTFEDHGPGIPDIALAMKDGYTSGGGLGLGLGGSKRLVNDFQLESQVGQGPKVTITRWK